MILCRKNKDIGENIYRAYSWYDIYSKIKEIENKKLNFI